MSSVVYVAHVVGGRSDLYRADFPDLPDCRAEGRDIGELLVDARRALLTRLEALENAGEAWPTPTSIEAIAPETGALLIPVDVTVDDPPIRVNISMGERLVQRLDAAAELRGMTRSGFIAQAVRVSLGETSQSTGDFDAAGRRLHDELSAMGRRINDSIGPESPFARRMNELDDVVYDGVRKAADSLSAAMVRRRAVATSAGQTNGAKESPAAEPDAV
jgi:predicted RNase H-like HicB family nuclease